MLNSLSVHYGFRPSGRIHLGNALTAVYACRLLAKSNAHEKNLIVTVNDFDGNNCERGEYDFGVPLALRDEGSVQRKKSTLAFLNFLRAISAESDILVKVISTTDLLNLEKSKDLVKLICENGQEVFRIIGSSKEGVPVFPLDTATKRYAHTATYDGKTIRATSYFETGLPSNFSYDLESKIPIELPIAVKLALKHTSLREEVDKFVLGGNYLPRTVSEMKAVSSLLGSSPDYYLAPLLINGNKVMSKTRDNVVTLEDTISAECPKEVYEKLERVIESGKRRIQVSDIIRTSR